MRVAETIELSAETERELRGLSKRRRVEARLQQRARVLQGRPGLARAGRGGDEERSVAP